MTPTRCAEVRPLLEDHVDNRLGPDAAALVRAHLAGCADCRREHEEAISIPSRLRALRAPEPPPALLTSVMSAVETIRETEARRGTIFWKPAVAEAILSAIIGWYISGFAGLGALTSTTLGELGQLFGWTFGSTALPPAPSADLVVVLACLSLIGVTTYHLMLIARSSGPRQRSRTT